MLSDLNSQVFELPDEQAPSRVGRMFPHAVDNTMMTAFRSCPQKFFRTYLQHWKPKRESVHLVAGGAFAKGIEVARKAFYEENADAGLAEAEGIKALIKAYGDFECPSDSAKSVERMAGALEFYFRMYPLGADGAVPVSFPNGRKAIEFSFAEPLDIYHPTTGAPILYTGRCDMVAEWGSGIYPFDEKTTSSLGATWSKQFEMSPQFTGYQWAVNKVLNLNAQGTVVRGISILKTKYDTQEFPTHRSPVEIQRWYDQTCRDLERMIRCWKEGYWDWNLGHACADYGGCPLIQVCKANHPEEWLSMYFEPRVWDPLSRKEMSVEEFEKSWEGE